MEMHLRRISFLVCLLWTFISAESGWTRVYIDIESPELQPLPIAIAQFEDRGRSQPNLGREIMKILTNDLTISGFFEIIPRNEFPQESNAIADPPDYKSWSTSRAEALVTGGYLYLFDLTRSAQIRLSTNPGLNAAPAWSPDGTKMALMMRKEGNAEIFIINRDGTHPKRLTKSWSSEASPTWSPDGRKIAFVSDRAGSPQIYTMDRGGKNMKRLTFSGPYNASPSWSLKGDRIVYCGRMDGRFEIFTISPDGMWIRRLTEYSGNNESPTWSPDGRFIAFSSTREGRSHIYVMNANGANQRRLTSTRGKESSPTWSPRMDR